MSLSGKDSMQGNQTSSKEDAAKVTPKIMSTFKQRFLKRDGSRFNKYIQSTTTHGVVYIFVGKSKFRRLFWLVIVLTAAIGCLYNVVNRVVFLVNGPISTTISITEPTSVDFPAVTLCNLNLVKRSFLDGVSPRLGGLIREVFYAEGAELECDNAIKTFDVQLPSNQSFSDLIWRGRHTAEDSIFSCSFMGRECNSSDFSPSLTPNGVCYTFNSGRLAPVILKAYGAGTRHSLSLVVGIQQNEYSAALSHDAGIKVAVHPQSEPPQPDGFGIAVAPGKNAFISMRQTNIEDKSSKRKCRDTSDTTSFNFLQGEFPYSVAACQVDCLRTNIARNCKCLGASMQQKLSAKSNFYNLSNCTIEDICCQVSVISQASACDCQQACKRTVYITGTSYSAFPANYAARDLAEGVKAQFNVVVNESVFKENFLAVNVYFETLTIEERITHDAYDAVALLSDIGGQLGLFLGASVISVFEFLTWLVDETKDRCCGVSERKIIGKLKSYAANIKAQNKHREQKEEGILNEVASDQGMDHYREYTSRAT